MSAPQRGLSAAADHSLAAWADAGEIRTADISNVGQLVRRLLGSVPHGGARLALALLLGVLATGSTVALMGVSAWLLSRAAEHPPVLYLQVAVVGVRFFGIGRGVFRYLERLVGHDLALRMQRGLRLATYDKLSRTTLLGRRRGDLLVRVTADVEAIMDLVVRVVLPFCSAAVVILGTSAMIAFFSPAAAVVLLATSLVAGIALPALARRLSADVDARAVVARGELAERISELARCSVDLVAYDAADDRLARLARADAELRRIESRAAWTRGITSGGQVLLAGLAGIGALVIGAELVASDAMLGRDLAVIVLVPLALHESFSDLTKAAQTLTRARTALGRVVDLLQAPAVGCGDRPLPSRPASASAPEPRPGLLVLDDVDAGWPSPVGQPELVVKGFSLTVQPGRTAALTGASGAGKTTLAATILGLIPPLAGRVQVPQRIGYLAQDAHVFATTVAENVRLGNRDATDEQVRDALRRAGLDLDPDRVLGEDGSTLSGGEARRVALARVLVSEHPELVILDEPTEHLDHDTAAALLDDLWEALAGTTLLVITHDPEVVARCDSVTHLMASST